ncbi:MAG: biotin--[acetyl-CoA-carboxylase] ligase [Woeseiaceae bacterium]
MSLNADEIRQHFGDAEQCVETLEVFTEITSTNTYLMQFSEPSEGCVRVAATDNQTAGRGRHGRHWHSPPGTGLCLSVAHSFANRPENLPALTLVVGLSVVDALKEHSIDGVQLKWPNDLIAMDAKLGGILTEAQSQASGGVTVVTGVGLNLDRGSHPEPLELSHGSHWSKNAIDLKRHAGFLPDKNALAASLINGLQRVLRNYTTGGFEEVSDRWRQYDWLHGRAVAIETPQQTIRGLGVGVDSDGALLVETQSAGVQRVTSGTVTMADVAGSQS